MKTSNDCQVGNGGRKEGKMVSSYFRLKRVKKPERKVGETDTPQKNGEEESGRVSRGKVL